MNQQVELHAKAIEERVHKDLEREQVATISARLCGANGVGCLLMS